MIRLDHAAVLFASALLVAACSSPGPSTSQESGASSAAPAAPQPAAPAGASTISGVITVDGTVRPARPVRVDSDPRCVRDGGTIESETLLVNADKGVQNVFVYVKDGLGNVAFPVPTTPVVLDQDGCRYTPHVLGVRVGQPLHVSNSDPTLHNVHAVPKENMEYNFGQMQGVPPATITFDKPEVMVPFRCDVHPWMTAYAGVMSHPFFAVTQADGRYEITGLPKGTYTIEAWHEQLGVQTQQITVDGTSSATAGFVFKSAAS